MKGHVRMLFEQLTAAVTEAAAGEGEPFEVAVLAGLLSRSIPADQPADAIAPLLAKARQFCESCESGSILPEESTLEVMADRFASIEDDAGDDELQELLLDLDEVCAGLWFLDATPMYLPMLEAIAATVSAYPDPFRSLSPWASRLLSETPPRAGDPALLIWRSVEASAFPEVHEPPPLCIRAATTLGVLPRFSRSQMRAQAAAQPQYFSTTTLKRTPDMTELLRGRDFEVGVSSDPTHGPILLIRCDSLPLLACMDVPIVLTPLGPTLYSAPAEPGLYVIEVFGERVGFEVTD